MRKSARTAALVLTIAMLTMSCSKMNLRVKQMKSPTQEKKEAIARINKEWGGWTQVPPVLRCAEIINETDRNVPAIEHITLKMIELGNCSLSFVKVAEYASQAPIATDEFIQIADLMAVTGGNTPNYVELARLASEAYDKPRMKILQEKIAWWQNWQKNQN